jgi:hypothetical protein
MTKKDMLKRIVEPVVLQALSNTYKINTSSPSDKQLALVESIADLLYPKLSDKLGVKELREILGEKDES